MEIYHALAAGTVVWLLASLGSSNATLPLIAAASLTTGLIALSRLLRHRRDKQQS